MRQIWKKPKTGHQASAHGEDLIGTAIAISITCRPSAEKSRLHKEKAFRPCRDGQGAEGKKTEEIIMKNSELLHLLDEAIAHGEGLINAAKAIRGKLVGDSGPASQPKTAAEPCGEETTEAPVLEKYTFTEVRKACSAKCNEGHTARVKALLGNFHAKVLREVSEEDYPKLMKALQEIA